MAVKAELTAEQRKMLDRLASREAKIIRARDVLMRETEGRYRAVLECRDAGITYRQIAATLDMTIEGVVKLMGRGESMFPEKSNGRSR